ncbi:hypothetical protein C9374_011984 [Naegleria lovaniensis]|uniref:RGS domain-containing protein n=1 Tax=Naegleria lovaniensis TaxID=51637 RepID=A0AA88G8U0_NAELO|nr:uncharacterized protein C9374_011984 [Naegleria lovaniensis]KAG2373695.1 hypothetical protein C9374_011984 [Naegleria lovaniensis]
MNQRQQSTQISSPSMSVKCTSRTSNNFMQQYKLGFKERIWYRMNDLLSRHTYIMMFLIAILGVHVVLWFCITVIENSFFAEDRFFMTNDSMSLFGCGAQYFPSVLALFIYCGFFCIECLCALLLLVRTDSDTWYIKKEALCLIPIQVLLGSLFLVTEFVEIFRILDHIVPSGTIMTTYTGIEIFVTIFLPICYAIYQDEKPKSEVYDTEMEMILNNKQAFESFLDHCRRSFCAEGLLFYKDLEKYKQCSSSTQRRDMALHIVQCYLVQGAPQELNIGNIETLREEILFVIHTNNHTVNKLPDHLFDRVKSVALTLKSKPQLILEAIQHNDLSSIDNPNLLKDREFIQKCVQLSGPSIRHFINQALDRETVLAAVKQDGHALAYFRQTDFHNDREVVSQAVQQNGRALEYASVKLRADKEIVLQAVRQDPSAIQYACHELQLDSDVFLASICPNVAHKYSNTNWNNNATWLFETLKHDREFSMDAVSRNGFSLEHASIDLKRKKEIVLAAVRNQPHALKYAVDDLKNDREVVLEAAQRDGTSLQYASTRLRSDKELILLTNILAFEYASNTLKNDKDFVLKILRKFGGAALQYVGYSLRSDKDVVLQAVSMADRHYRTLEHASKSLLKDRDVVLAAVKACGLALLCVSELWGHDKEIVLEAVKHDKLAFNYATKELKAEKDVVWAAMGSGLKGVQVLDKQEAVEIVRRYGRALDYLPDVYQNDHDVRSGHSWRICYG